MMQKKTEADHAAFAHLKDLINGRTAVVGICGLGYVGLPLALQAVRSGFRVVGFDINHDHVQRLNSGTSNISSVRNEQIAAAVNEGKFSATAEFSALQDCDIIIICVPTPLSRHRAPDLQFVIKTAQTIAAHLRGEQLIILESTTYPGTTREILKPILERAGFVSGHDIFLSFSPEREDPGNPDFNTASIPKIVSGEGPQARELAETFYGAVVEKVVGVSSNQVAEAVKLTENIFRAVNIALINELKIIYAAMGIDVWEVIDAAKTKPFGYMPFYPGPGLGGHCIPIDPFYLTWKAREYGLSTRFIELAGEINVSMPRVVVERAGCALNAHAGTALKNARILIIGVAYKKNVSDTRESPSFKLLELFEQRGSSVDFHDPLVPVIPRLREHPEFAGRRSIALEPAALGQYDLALIATDHDAIDYRMITEHARLVVDTRNACARNGCSLEKVVKA